MFDNEILAIVRLLTLRCVEHRVRMVFAESCTGGLIAGAMTSLAGSSRVVDRGFVVYSNESKVQELGVPQSVISTAGAVSGLVAVAMAEGALRIAEGNAQLSVATTGVAGPDGTPAKPAGLVYVAATLSVGETICEKREFTYLNRTQVRRDTILAALDLARRCLEYKS